MTVEAALRATRLHPGAWPRSLPLPAAGGGPELWLVPPGPLRTEVAALAGSVLDGAEKERAARLRRQEDREAYIAAHVGLRLLLGAYLGTAAAGVPLYRLPCTSCGRPHGRPAVHGDPVHFSLSHADGLCLLAFAATTVGVDVEPVPAPAVAEELAAALHPRESAELLALPPVQRTRAFARLWTRKEAYLKGLGTGLNRLPSLDYLGGSAEGAATAPPGWAVADIAVDDGYAAAVAYRC
ncbi:4'-phosphopantetheinyl transferase superfamily protein [Streptomyces sp. NBC_01351]|uniref:4'-phosphopantetheinyl transferase family protein n=1 Tax=Streptomyces sp. NBC_01351 TaxID=2903833 RepID=UPI002E2F01E5|nr:4'-phosphopantetheinyl transferase superfamily protein [Streptomyces sp. NBC_01351]